MSAATLTTGCPCREKTAVVERLRPRAKQRTWFWQGYRFVLQDYTYDEWMTVQIEDGSGTVDSSSATPRASWKRWLFERVDGGRTGVIVRVHPPGSSY